jgi:PKD repeat protein
VLAVIATLALAGTALVAGASAGADDPINPVTETEIDLTCRANSPIGVQNADQSATFRVEAPESVAPGETFDIVLRPGLSEFPTSASGATIRKILDLQNNYRIPEGLTVNSVTEEAPPGSATVGYYLAPGADRNDPSLRQEIPGGSSATWIPASRYVRTVLNGTGSPTSNTGEFRGGSAVQPPHVRINVTNTAPGGTVLETRLGGTLPANLNSLPWADPSLQTTTRANLIVDTTTTAYCAPAPGESTVLASTTVAGPAFSVTSPIEGGNYAQGDEVEVDFDCESTALFTVETCEASVDGDPVANGGLLPTGSLGAKEFLVTAEDPDGRISTFGVPYTVVENSLPVVDAGPDQTGVATSATVTLSGSATDSDGPPPQSLTTEWTQLSGPEVTLADPSALQTTFTAPFEGPATLVFQLTATDSVGGQASDTVTIEVLANRNPIADAGEEQTVAITQTATLDASASSDPDGHPITFSWAQTGGVPVTLSGATTATPSFTAPIAAAGTQLTFEVTVSDDRGGVATATAIVNVAANEPPVANAGPDQNGVRSLQTVTLNGSGSADPFGLDITYQWTQVSGVPVTLSNPNAVNPTFVMPPKPDFIYPHSVVFELVVTDELGLASAPDTVSINVIATAPTVGTPVRTPTDTPCAREDLVWTAPLTNPDGYPIVWEWQLTRDQASFFAPAGTAAASSTTAGTFSNLDQADPKMRLPNAARTTANGPQVRTRAIAQLPGGGTLASAFTGNSATFAVTAATSSPCNARPVANSGPYQDVAPGSTVTLSGVGFPFGSGSISGFTWTQTAGTPVTLSGANTANATFTAPADLGDLRFQLVVNQGATASRPSPTKVRVVPAPPTANAGPDQTGIVVGESVTLNGSASVGEPGVTLGYQWTQISGPAVTLADATTTTPSFTAPGGPATLVFQLRVSGSNTTLTSTDTVSIFVNNSPPTANAGPNQVSTSGLTVTLNGTASSDPDGQTLSYTWTQVSGIPVTLSNPSAAQPTFTAPDPGPLVFVLTVSDGQGGFDSDAITVTVFPPANASFTATPNRGLAPLTVAVDASATTSPNGPVVIYQWDFGNGQTATGVNATTTYTTPGNYTITLTVTDNQGAKGTTTRIVEVPPLPVATFTATPLAADPPFTVELDASGSTSADGNIVSYEWDFGDGRTGSGVTTSVEYDETQDNQAFTITLTAVWTPSAGRSGSATSCRRRRSPARHRWV